MVKTENEQRNSHTSELCDVVLINFYIVNLWDVNRGLENINLHSFWSWKKALQHLYIFCYFERQIWFARFMYLPVFVSICVVLVVSSLRKIATGLFLICESAYFFWNQILVFSFVARILLLLSFNGSLHLAMHFIIYSCKDIFSDTYSAFFPMKTK